MHQIELSKQLITNYNKILISLPLNATLFIAGGGVRDALLHKPITELDLEAHNVLPNDFELAMQKLNANGVGKSFFIYKYQNCDISLPRIERKTSFGHTGFEVELASNMQDACQRRDFTINAMLYNPKTNELLDFFNGRNDLANKIIKATNHQSFGEDSLRVLRAARFAAKLGFKIELQTINICQDILLHDLSGARIWGELEKIFASEHKIYALYYLFKLEIAQKIWGITNTKPLLQAIRFLKHSNKASQFLLPYVIRQFWNIPYSKILQHAPKYWQKELALHPKRPHKITKRFIAGLSLKLAPKDWLGANISGSKTDYAINAQSVMAQGYINSDISKQIKLQQKAYIIATH